MRNSFHFTIFTLIYLQISIMIAMDNEFDELDEMNHIPIVRNQHNPNFFDIVIFIDNTKYSLPLSMTEDKLLIPSHDFNDIITKSYSLIQKKGIKVTHIKQTTNFIIENCQHSFSKKLTYLLGIEYLNFNFMSWFPLAKIHPKTDDTAAYQAFNSFGFSITLKNNTHGVLNIGDHKTIKQGINYSSSGLFFCPQIQNTKYWGCTIKAIVSENIINYINDIDGMDGIDINEKMNVFHVNEGFYFDMTQRYFLVPFHFFLFLKNSSMKRWLESEKCRIIIDKDDVYSFICNKNAKTKLPSLNIIVLHWLIIFSDNELVEDIPNSDEVIFKIISHQKQKNWVIGQFFFMKYSVIFKEYSDYLEIFSYDKTIKAVVVYSYKNSKTSLKDYDLTDIIITDNRLMVNWLLCFICIFGLSFLVYVKVSIIKNVKSYL